MESYKVRDYNDFPFMGKITMDSPGIMRPLFKIDRIADKPNLSLKNQTERVLENLIKDKSNVSLKNHTEIVLENLIADKPKVVLKNQTERLLENLIAKLTISNWIKEEIQESKSAIYTEKFHTYKNQPRNSV